MRLSILMAITIICSSCANTPPPPVLPPVVTGSIPANIVIPKPVAANKFSGNMQGILAAHNRVRQQSKLKPLRWSKPIAVYATQWAKQLASGNACQLKHRSISELSKRGYGENLFAMSALNWPDGRVEPANVTARQVVQSWANERNFYNHAKNSCQSGRQCGHYTQLVWSGTQQVGCGVALCSNKAQVWVCNYNPPGNWRGQRPY